MPSVRAATACAPPARRSAGAAGARARVVAPLLLLASGLLAQPAPADRPGTPPPPPSLLLVTIDTWRWDYIGAAGTGRVETPHLDRLAGGGVYDREAVTPCPLTTPAHASILTGMDPLGHMVLDCTRYRLGDQAPTMAEAFREAGYATAAFVASETLRSRFGLGRGFGLYDDSGITRRGREDWMAASRDGRDVTEALLRYLPTLPAGQRAFVWAHYFDLHLPYRPRPAYDGKYPRDPYAAQAAFVDGEIGRILGALESDAGRSWRIVVVGDHGEGLGEHGEDTHGIGLYRATLHVPMILFPKPEAPLLQAKPWGLVDLAPTIRDWFGLPPAGLIDGTSLFRRDRPGRALFLASAEPSLLFGVEPALGVRQGASLYLRGGGEELFDLRTDPGQTRDLSGSAERAVELGRLRGLCDRTWPPGWPAEVLPPSLRPSPEELKNLQSLGYLSGAVPAAGTLQRTPIREVMKDKDEWDREREAAFRTGKEEALSALYARLLKKYPGSYALRNWYGPLLARAGRYQEAIGVLKPAARLYPQDGTTLLNLGAVYVAMGEPATARSILERALEREPDNRRIYKELGNLYAEHLSDPRKAIAHYRKYMALGGDNDAPKILRYVVSQERLLREAP